MEAKEAIGPFVEKGFATAMECGPIAGYPLIDIRATLTKATVDPDQASAMAFKVAAVNALRDAARNTKVQLLEPTFKVEVVTPEEFLGSVIGDLNSRRGKVNGMEPRGADQIVSAEMPLETMFGYATDLRSMSQGRATFSMEFLEYSVVPAKTEQEILKSMGR